MCSTVTLWGRFGEVPENIVPLASDGEGLRCGQTPEGRIDVDQHAFGSGRHRRGGQTIQQHPRRQPRKVFTRVDRRWTPTLGDKLSCRAARRHIPGGHLAIPTIVIVVGLRVSLVLVVFDAFTSSVRCVFAG